MRFVDFLRTTVVLSAGAASLLAAVTVVSVATGRTPDHVGAVAAVWWVLATLLGVWVGRRADASPPIASLLAGARTARSLPDANPARTVVNRLWPLLVCCLGAAGVGLAVPQVPAIAAGFAIVWALGWRRQAGAVRAIEERDGARFYVERTPPASSIRLVRAPGFRTLPDPAGDGHAAGSRR